MARTRLRGLEIGGIQIGIEVSESCPWEWPDAPIADYQCLPRRPEVHVGVRIGEVGDADLGGERYGMGAWTFEVARRGADWLLGLSRNGSRLQLALFDEDFEAGEVVLARHAPRGSYPLRGPLDEWVVLHRTVARGGLCLTASAFCSGGQARVRLGVPAEQPGCRWSTPRGGLLGRHVVLIREERDELRLFRTPWSESIDPMLGREARVCELECAEPAELAFREALDPGEAADRLVSHAIVPLCDERLLDRVLRNARRLGSSSRVLEVGEVPTPEAAIAWRSTVLAGALAPPTRGL